VSILLVDIGNTRVKWARLEKGRLRRQRAAAHSGWNAGDFESTVFNRPRGIERVIVASVAGPQLNRALTAAARRCCGVSPELIKTRRHAGAVRTLYEDPWRLGVDRFIAAIAGHHLARRRAVCIADIGTAMTIDLVDARGTHRGGVILPGPDLMIRSLLKDTSGIERRAKGARSSRRFFARNTRAAIEEGARNALAAAVDRAVDEARSLLDERPLLILTGGAALQVRCAIRSKHRFIPDLILKGLAVAYDSKFEI
jgi:type III pantothenate kinase